MDAVLARILGGGSAGSRVARWWPELTIGTVWSIAFAVLVGMPLSHDVVWQLWIARHMNAGVGLYTWIMEVNPPLWYWMAQPIDLLSAGTGIAATTLLAAAVFLLIGVSLGLSAALLADRSEIQRAAILGTMLFAFAWICLSDFAQREQLCLIGIIPYALLVARRIERRSVDWRLALASGLLATPLVALKHYFILAPLLLEIWLIWRQRRQWRPVRMETATLATGAVLYAAAILLLAPDYLTELVPLLRMAYGDLHSPLGIVLLNRMTLALPVAALYFWHFRRELSAPAQAFLLLLAAFLASYWLQFKGWGYHVDPVVSCLILAVVAHLALRPALPRLRWTEMATALAIPVIALSSVAAEGPYTNTYARAADRLLASAQPGMTVVMLTTKPTKIWPMAEDRGLLWPSRYFHFWMMQSVANSQRDGVPMSPALSGFIDQVRLDTVEDFRCNPPDILISDRASIDAVEFDLLAVMRQEPTFESLLTAYEPIETLGPFTAQRRVGVLPPPTGPCVKLIPAR